MENTRIVIPLLIVGVIVSLITVLNRDDEPKESVTPIPVRVAKISEKPPIDRVLVAGTTESAESALLRFQVAGRVIERKVSLGDSIEQGDILATVYNPELEPLVKLASDNLANANEQQKQAKRDFDRVNALFEKQAVTRQEWEQSKLGLTSSTKAESAAEAELARAKQVSAETELVSPFSGRITEILIDKGEVVAVGAPAIRVSNPSAVELSLPLSDKMIAQISLGQTVAVTPSLSPELVPIAGVISEISPFREKGALPEVKITLNSEQIGPGVSVNAAIKVRSRKGLSLPLQSVIMTGEQTVAVYQVLNGVAKLTPIRPIRIDSQSVVVDQGINPGVNIVTEGLTQLYDGAKVEVQP